MGYPQGGQPVNVQQGQHRNGLGAGGGLAGESLALVRLIIRKESLMGCVAGLCAGLLCFDIGACCF